MEYTKVTCTLTPDNELARELLIAELGNAGFESFVETDDAVEAYIQSADFSPEILASDNLKENDLYNFEYTVEVMADQNWNEEWEKNYFEALFV